MPDEPPIKQVRLRDFEAPMSGAFYLVERCDELAEFFEPDEEIVFFEDADELAEKAKYYLSHHAERERIRQARDAAGKVGAHLAAALRDRVPADRPESRRGVELPALSSLARYSGRGRG